MRRTTTQSEAGSSPRCGRRPSSPRTWRLDVLGYRWPVSLTARRLAERSAASQVQRTGRAARGLATEANQPWQGRAVHPACVSWPRTRDLCTRAYLRGSRHNTLHDLHMLGAGARGKRAGIVRASLEGEVPKPVQHMASPRTSEGPAIAKATLRVRAGVSEDSERVGKLSAGQHVVVSHVVSGDGDAVRAQVAFDKDGSTVTGFVTAVQSDKKGGGVLLVEDVHYEEFLKRYQHAHWKPETVAAATALTQRSFYKRMLNAGYDPDTTDGRTKGDHGVPNWGFLTADPND
jgi:hypothetical protein